MASANILLVHVEVFFKPWFETMVRLLDRVISRHRSGDCTMSGRFRGKEDVVARQPVVFLLRLTRGASQPTVAAKVCVL